MIALADVKLEDDMVYCTLLVDGFPAGGLALPEPLYAQLAARLKAPVGRPKTKPTHFCGGCGKKLGRTPGPKVYPDGKPRCSKCAGELRRIAVLTPIQADVMERWNTFPELTLLDMAEFYGVSRQYIDIILNAIQKKGYEVRKAHGGAINPLRVCAVCGKQQPSQSNRNHLDGMYYCPEHRPVKRQTAKADRRDQEFLEYMRAAEREGRPIPTYAEAAKHFGVHLQAINRYMRRLRNMGIEPPHRPSGAQPGNRSAYGPRPMWPKGK